MNDMDSVFSSLTLFGLLLSSSSAELSRMADLSVHLVK